jgi:hypothetical protein
MTWHIFGKNTATSSKKQAKSTRKGVVDKKELILPGRRHWVLGVHQMDNGGLTVEGLVMGGGVFQGFVRLKITRAPPW